MRRRAVAGVLFAVLVLTAACADGEDEGAGRHDSGPDPAVTTSTTLPSATTTIATTTTPTSVIPTSGTPTSGTAATAVATTAGRPYDLFVPSNAAPDVGLPLVVNLHGFTSSSFLQEDYLDLKRVAQERGFIAVHPDGTRSALGIPFWNATDGCCNFTGSTVDDSGYLAAVIDEVAAAHPVDPDRIYVIGFSNGGFMSHRMACDHADRIAAIVSLAGATWSDPSRCPASEPVSVLQIHGTADEVIGYGGGAYFGSAHPSAAATTATWAALNGCRSTEPVTAGTLDLVADIGGAETTVQQFLDCPADGAVELWTMDGARHIAALSDSFTDSVIDFLLAHPAT